MDAFKEVEDQLQWAQTHIDVSEDSLKAYIRDDAFTRVIEVDAETQEHVQKVRIKNPIPLEVKGMLRNALVDIKHSFDMSLHAAAHTMGFTRFDANYPWAESDKGLRGMIERRQAKKDAVLPQVLVDEIWKQEPYARGPSGPTRNKLIREVAKLTNDKHSIGFVLRVELPSYALHGVTIQDGEGLVAHGRWDAEKQEIELWRLKRGYISYDKATLGANIFLESAGKVGKIPAHVVARQFVDHAKLVLEGFKRVSGS